MIRRRTTLIVAGFAAAWFLPIRAEAPTVRVAMAEADKTRVKHPRPERGFHMPPIALPSIPKAISYKSMGPWKIRSSSNGWKQLRLENNWLFVRGGGASGLRLTDIEARSHGIIMRGSNLPKLRVERVRVVQGRTSSAGGGIVTVWNGADGAVFRDLTYVGDPKRPAPNGSSPWAGIALAGKDANDTGSFSIERFDFSNLVTEPGDRYPNADGISTERGYSGTIANGRVTNASDACLDIKGDVSVDNVYLSGCREGIKAWSDQKHGLIAMGTNRVAAILGAGTPSRSRSMYIETLILDGNPAKPLLRAEKGIFNLTIGTLVAARDQKLMDENSFKGSSVKILRRVTR
ncbi:hypothetical protein [Novosphingobium endophyticum]|nr:hypothetical protein [Novosphingobium endophyticum]